MRFAPGSFVLAVCAVCAAHAGPPPVDSPDDVCPPAASPCQVTADLTVVSGTTLDFGARELRVKPGKRLDAGTGSMTILAGAVTVEGGGALAAPGGSMTVVTTGGIAVLRSGNSTGRIEVGHDADAGSLTLSAGGTVDVQGEVDAIGKDAGVSGGLVQITGDSVAVSGTIDAHGGRADVASGGFVGVTARSTIAVGGLIDASGGEGGDVACDAGAALALDGTIDVHGTGAGGYGGGIDLLASDGPVDLRGQLRLRGSDGGNDTGGGGGGHLEASAGESLTLDGTVELTGAPPDGPGGDVVLQAEVDLLLHGAIQASGKGGESDGGTLDLLAKRRLVAGNADTHGATIGGSISATAWCTLEVPSGVTLDARGPDSADIRLETGGTMAVAGALVAGTSVVLASRPGGTITVTGPAPMPAADVVVDALLVPCGGPPAPGCGNGTVDAGEQCDDGNTTPCDGCSAICHTEGCGNDVAECDESCDDGNTVACDGCTSTCARSDRVCGDTIVECGEEADLGDTQACDGVSPACRLETCGNGNVDCGEDCDDGPGGSPTCSPACRTVVPGCGNGALDAGEDCDDGGVTDCDGCSHLCLVEGPGNGVVECAEECDDGNATACDGCGTTGRFEGCGNGVLDCQEECDAGDANGTPASSCLPESCTRGELCTPDSTGPCIPCTTSRDCGPLGPCGGDRCEAGICILGTPLSCSDGDACTTDACDPDAGCRHATVACDDGLPCTIDACVPASGCTHTPGGCGPGVCTPSSCTDGNPCTAEDCDPVTGCTSRGDTSCDDGDACTDDACDPAAGCASVRRRGASGLRCLLDALEAYVAGIPADGLGTKTRKRVGRTLAAMRAKLAPLGTPVPRKADRAARSIGKLRAKAEKTVRRARDVRPEVAAALLDMLTRRMPSLR